MEQKIRVMVAEDLPLLREDFCDVVSSQEDMEVVAHIEGLLPHIGPYKRSVRRGAFYKKIVRLKADASTKSALCGKLSSLLGGSRTDYYLERVSKCLGFVLPSLPSERGDRL